MDDTAVVSQPVDMLPQLRLFPHVEAYLADVTRMCTAPGSPVLCVVLFGSAATGDYAAAVSDVDLLVVLRDDASTADRCYVRDRIDALELHHGLAKPRSQRRSTLEMFAERITANARAFFVCTRSDLVSGSPARILDIPPAQALFVDRVAIPSILGSAAVVWGEDLLAEVRLPPIRRLDVGKAFFGLFNHALFCAASYAALPGATKYAMDALKRSIHSCYFCSHGRSAPLTEEVAYFEEKYGARRTLAQLLALRREYRPSFGFVLGCLPAIAWLHLRTALGNRFPRGIEPSGGAPRHRLTAYMAPPLGSSMGERDR
jgi:predicted nucleotidyltransferase